MKKKLLVIGLYSLTSVMMFSCKKDDPTPVTTELPTKFSSKSTEENKAQLETNGIQLVNDLEALKNSKGVEAVSSLATFMNSTGSSMRKSSAGELLMAIKNLRKGTGSSDAVFSSMRLSQEYGSIKEVYYNHAGTYTWNSSIDDFDYVSGGNQIVFKYPSKETGTSNNAVLTIKDYQGVVKSTTYLEGYTGDLPTKLLMDVTVDGTKVMDYTFGATYNEAGEPTSVNTKLTVAPFAFSISMTNNTEVAGFDYSFTKDAKTLVSFGASAKGNFKTADMNSEGGNDVINEGTAHFQLLNIKISGTIDIAAINKEIEANPTAKEEDVINKYMKLMVYYVDSNEKIADTEYYTFTKTYTYTYYEDRDNNGTYEEYNATYEDTRADLRLIFADGSKSDLETYFSTGFDNLISKIDTLVQ